VNELLSRTGNPGSYALGFLVSVLAALLVLVAIGVLGEYTKTLGRFLLTALLLATYCVVSLGPAILVNRNLPRVIPAAGLTMTWLAIILLLVGVWGTPNSDGFWKGASIASLLAVALAYSGWAHWLESPWRTARRSARVSAIAAMGLAATAGVGIAVELKLPAYWWAFALIVLVWAASGLLAPVCVLWGRWYSNRRPLSPTEFED
jgi:hypothetical protein